MMAVVDSVNEINRLYLCDLLTVTSINSVNVSKNSCRGNVLMVKPIDSVNAGKSSCQSRERRRVSERMFAS